MMTTSTIFADYVQFLIDSAFYPGAEEKTLEEFVYLESALSGESGEFSDEFKKVMRDTGLNEERFQAALTPAQRFKMVMELGDTLYYLTRLARFFGLTLEELAVLNTFKLYERHTGGQYSDKDWRQHTTKEDMPWPIKDIPYDDVLKLMQHTGFQITDRSASTSTDTDTSSKQ